jgi:transposase
VDANDSERPLPARHGQNHPEIALGRRNSLFAGSTRGAEAWAILASIVSTAKLHELDPQTYLADVLEKIVSGQTKMNALHELLPWTWKAARATEMGAAA